MTETNRDTKGRFGPGNQANPAGRPKLTTEQRIERALTTHGPAILDRAFVEAKTDNAVLAALLSFLSTCQGAANIAYLAAQQPGARH
ncbi:MAG: hypothetical protein AB7E55_06715 [Pigmentiphaga sp.]